MNADPVLKTFTRTADARGMALAAMTFADDWREMLIAGGVALVAILVIARILISGQTILLAFIVRRYKPAFLAIPAVLAGFLAAFGRLISPHVRHVQRPPGEKWVELQRDDNG